MTAYRIALARFDTALLPPEARQIGTEAFKAAVVMYAAFRQIDPALDAGLDFSAEYEAAVKGRQR